MSIPRRLTADALGTGFLLIAVVGSGILGERLAAGNTAVALLANALATGAALFALIEWLAPLSGAHFNPLVTLALAVRGDTRSAPQRPMCRSSSLESELRTQCLTRPSSPCPPTRNTALRSCLANSCPHSAWLAPFGFVRGHAHFRWLA
jgi:hypothetical protein